MRKLCYFGLVVIALGCGSGASNNELPKVDPEEVRLETDLADPASAAGAGTTDSMKKAAAESKP